MRPFIHRFFTVLLILSITVTIIIYYAVKIEPYTVTINNVNLNNNFPENLKIIQISDIQISENYQASDFQTIISQINQLSPDIFIFTGDLYENYSSYGPEEELIQLLAGISAAYGKYAVWGNRDYGGGAVRRFERIMTAGGFQVLCNEGVHIMLNNGERLFLAGLDDSLMGNPNITPILSQMKEDDSYRILMLHEPDAADLYADYGFELMLAGHSHGGQVNLPFLSSPTTSMAEKYQKGLYDMETSGKIKLYVNSGIGTSHFPIRFRVPPEIIVFD